jgi:sialate O-acetylesterase
MVFSLKADANAKAEIPKADYPAIRYFSVKRQYGPQEFEDCEGSAWAKTSPETAPGFSAVAYYFAKKIHQQLHVPVGIVYAAWGGTPAEAWTPASALKSDAELNVYIERWKNMYLTVGKDSMAYQNALDSWEKTRKTGDSNKVKKPAEPATLVSFNRPWREPSVLFNGMINPVIPYAFKGILWYQGESNVSYADEYFHLFSSMINSWRERWNNQKDLPFYFVQIAPFGYSNMDAAARLREAQYQVMQQLPHTGMAVTVDVGEMKDQHFTHKKEVGDRLAMIAFANDYGDKKIVYKGPEIKNAFTENEKVILEYKSSALTFKGDGLKGFEIGYAPLGTDSLQYVKADAKLEGAKVIVWNEKVRQPKEVRYAWLLAGEANLFDKEGLPAFPFRQKVEVKNRAKN